MTKYTEMKWSTDSCPLCEEVHKEYSGKLDSNGKEYVVCGVMGKRMNVSHDHPAWIGKVITETLE